MEELQAIIVRHPQKQITTIRPFDLPSRLWTYLAEKALCERASNRWQNLNKKELNRLVNILCNDGYQIAGRAAFKDEFVTCGGVSLSAVDPVTLESKDGKEYKYQDGDIITVKVTPAEDVPETVLEFTFSAVTKRKCVIKDVEFESVEE